MRETVWFVIAQFSFSCRDSGYHDGDYDDKDD